jgi:hypothetical protein
LSSPLFAYNQDFKLRVRVIKLKLGFDWREEEGKGGKDGERGRG